MTVFNMFEFLNRKTADYDYTLDLSPQKQVIEMGKKKQLVRVSDDGSEERISIDNDTHFVVTFDWAGLTESQMGEVFDLYFDSAKANGKENTFYWSSPLDSVNFYVVRFLTDFSRDIGPSWVHASKSLRLKVLGYWIDPRLTFGDDPIFFSSSGDQLEF